MNDNLELKCRINVLLIKFPWRYNEGLCYLFIPPAVVWPKPQFMFYVYLFDKFAMD